MATVKLSKEPDFKVIAIKALKGCRSESLKILKHDVLYRFYNDYVIENNSVIHSPVTPYGLFTLDKTRLNVSAIVGKNGTGKSSLVELLIQAINNISYHLNIGGGVTRISGLKLELYFQSDAYYKFELNDTFSVYKQDFNKTDFEKINHTANLIRNFFYTIIINYSHYGLNSNEIGTWINSLFHKNDGYQTPIVINPMRTDGNIDINIETALTKSRVVANLIRSSIRGGGTYPRITEKLTATAFKLKLKTDPNPVVYELRTTAKSRGKKTQTKTTRTTPVRFSSLEIDPNEMLIRVDRRYNFKYKGEFETGNLVIDAAHQYIIKKLIKIATTYPLYERYFNREEKSFVLKEFDKFLILLFDENENHISFKLKQVLNFLKFRHIKTQGSGVFYLDIKTFSKDIDAIFKSHRLHKDRIIECLPPPIFEVDIALHNLSEEKGNTVFFDKLSSGEKQLIYSVNSILYHLINLDSIVPNQFQKGYRFINIILEEIELYFHPEMQRQFAGFLLKQISEVECKRIKGINICIVTHSPFILSDIPNSNILFLNENGVPQEEALEEKTFGANVHDLLKNSFFLNDGYMGEFAEDKINSALDYLQILINPKHKPNAKPSFIWDKDSVRDFIELIGEPLIRNSLRELYLQAFVLINDAEIDKEIEFLQKKKKNIKAVK